jgi:hypothetical protein
MLLLKLPIRSQSVGRMGAKVTLSYILPEVRDNEMVNRPKERLFITQRPRVLKYQGRYFKRMGEDSYLEYFGDLDPDDDLGIIVDG